MVQAINIVRLSNTRSKMLQLLKDFGLDQKERSYIDLSVDTLSTLSCTLDLVQQPVTEYNFVAHQRLLKSIRSSAGDLLLQIDPKALEDFGLRALLWCYGYAGDSTDRPDLVAELGLIRETRTQNPHPHHTTAVPP